MSWAKDLSDADDEESARSLHGDASEPRLDDGLTFDDLREQIADGIYSVARRLEDSSLRIANRAVYAVTAPVFGVAAWVRGR